MSDPIPSPSTEGATVSPSIEGAIVSPSTEGPPSDCGPDCQEALADLERFLDGELPSGDIGRVKQHLSACYPCTDRASFEEQLRALVRRGCVDAAPEDLVERIRTGLLSGDLPGVDPAEG